MKIPTTKGSKMTATLSPVKSQQSGVFDLQGLLRAMAKTNVSTSKTPVATRKASREAFTRPTPQQLEEFKDLAETLPAVVGVFDTCTDKEVVLTPRQATKLMREYLAIQAMEDKLTARKARVREMVFGSITGQYLVDNPAMVDADLEPGSVEDPETGKRFAREGGGRQDPTWDMVGLKAELGPEVWSQVSRTVKVPRKVIAAESYEELDEEALAAWMITNGSTAMSTITKHLVPGAPKPSKLNVRVAQPKVDEDA